MTAQVKRVSYGDLVNLVMALLISHGLTQPDAAIVTDSLVEADLCGVGTHGVAVLPAHLERIEKGGYNIAPRISVIRKGPSFTVLDGDNAMGPISANHSMRVGMEGARQNGVHLVLSRNNNTFGPAFYYTSLAAQVGMIGVAICNSPASMAPWGGRDKMLGTNPVSIAVPRKGKAPILLDMATSAVAKSKINIAKIRGESIPLGWATNAEGVPTTDPDEAIAGLVLPMSGHKGYGLALMFDILAGVLSGAAFLDGVGSFYRNMENGMNVGYMFLVLDPDQLYGSEFDQVIEEYVLSLKSCNPAANQGEVLLPGENKARQRATNVALGPELHFSVVEKLNVCAAQRGIEIRL